MCVSNFSVILITSSILIFYLKKERFSSRHRHNIQLDLKILSKLSVALESLLFYFLFFPHAMIRILFHGNFGECNLFEIAFTFTLSYLNFCTIAG